MRVAVDRITAVSCHAKRRPQGPLVCKPAEQRCAILVILRVQRRCKSVAQAGDVRGLRERQYTENSHKRTTLANTDSLRTGDLCDVGHVVRNIDSSGSVIRGAGGKRITGRQRFISYQRLDVPARCSVLRSPPPSTNAICLSDRRSRHRIAGHGDVGSRTYRRLLWLSPRIAIPHAVLHGALDIRLCLAFIDHPRPERGFLPTHMASNCWQHATV